MVTKRKRTGEPNASSSVSTRPSEAARSTDTREDRPARRTVKPRRRRWPFVVVGSIVAVVLVIVAAFSWDRWLRYDDATEVQGEWQIQGSTGVIVIDGQQIKLTEDVQYSYVLDPVAKTLSFSFGAMTGEGRYRFSADRSKFIIVDGSEYTWFSTLTEDIAWMVDQAMHSVQGHASEEDQASDGATVLDRLSHNAQATPIEGTAAPTEETPTDADTGETPAQETPSDSGNAQGDADPGVPAMPGGVFDVNDVPA